MARTYNQECVLAYALDLLGERWTLLIVRELFLGPQRFGDLHAALPGIGTNLLSKRLKELEEAGLIMQTSAEARSQYKLSDAGEDLRPVIRSMMFWSIKYFMESPEPTAPKECIFSNDLQPDSVVLASEMFANLSKIPHDTYVMHLFVDNHPYTLYYMNGETTAKRGADAPAVAKLESDVETLMRAMRGEIFIEETLERSTSSGDAEVIKHFVSTVTPGADVAFEVAELIKVRERERLAADARSSAPKRAAPKTAARAKEKAPADA